MNYDFKVNIVRNYVVIGNILARKCTITYDSTKEVMRTLRVEMLENSESIQKAIVTDGSNTSYKYETIPKFNMFSDRIQPVLIQNGTEYPLGLFMIVANPEKLSDLGSYFDIEAYDETMLLKQACTIDRVYYPAGTNYMQIIQQLLVGVGFTNIISEATDDVLRTDREFKFGTPYISIINQLLEEINYSPIYADANGYIHLVSRKVGNTPDFIYNDLNVYNIKRPIIRNTDIYDLPNVLVGIASNPDIDDVLYYKRENNEVDSKISIVNRGYRVVKTYEFSNVASQDVLKDYIDAMYLKSTQATETIEFDSSIQPNHEYESILQVDTNLIDGFYVEKQWSMELSSRATMHHVAERRVFV